MKLTSTTTVVLNFDIAYYEDCEGGMRSGSFGETVSTLEAAVEQWRLANVAEPRREWVIVSVPQINVNQGKAA